MKRNTKQWLLWVGLLISVVFLYLAFRKIDYQELWATLVTVRYWWLLPGLAIYFVGVFVRTWRWQLLLNPLKKAPFKTLFPIINIGYMGNNVFPLRMGEVLRAVVLKRRESVSISGSLATIVVERIFDAVVVMGFVLLNLGELTSLPGSGVLPAGQPGDLGSSDLPGGVGCFCVDRGFPKTSPKGDPRGDPKDRSRTWAQGID